MTHVHPKTTIKNNLEDHRKKSAEENSKRKNVQDRLKKLKLDDVEWVVDLTISLRVLTFRLKRGR